MKRIQFTKLELEIIFSTLCMSGGSFDEGQLPSYIEQLGESKISAIYDSAVKKISYKINNHK